MPDWKKIIEELGGVEDSLETAAGKAKEAADEAQNATDSDDRQLKGEIELLREQALDLYEQAAALDRRVKFEHGDDE